MMTICSHCKEMDSRALWDRKQLVFRLKNKKTSLDERPKPHDCKNPSKTADFGKENCGLGENRSFWA